MARARRQPSKRPLNGTVNVLKHLSFNQIVVRPAQRQEMDEKEHQLGHEQRETGGQDIADEALSTDGGRAILCAIGVTKVVLHGVEDQAGSSKTEVGQSDRQKRMKCVRSKRTRCKR